MGGSLFNSIDFDSNVFPLLNFSNKPNLNQNNVLTLESSDEKNSAFASKLAKN